MTRLLRILQATTTMGGGNSTTQSASAAPPPPEVTIESDFVVILAALLCALIGVVGLIAVARCSCLRRGGGSGGSGVTAARSPANKGLKKKVVQSLPKFTYISRTSNENDDDNNNATTDASNSSTDNNNSCNRKWMVTSECAICLAEFQEGDEIRVMPQCGHGFHSACIDAWLVSHSSCPSCRQILVVPRCQKCGLYPAITSSTSHGGGRVGGGGGVVVIAVDESQVKVAEEEGGNASHDQASASGEGQHQAADNDSSNGNYTIAIGNKNESGNSSTFLP